LIESRFEIKNGWRVHRPLNVAREFDPLKRYGS